MYTMLNLQSVMLDKPSTTPEMPVMCSVKLYSNVAENQWKPGHIYKTL